ncbi:MAG: porin [Fusobacterium sp.]|uniref:major outer membrane protein FomA n=1 Tax=Fusobacterium sp. TaxID=68766 RepID=UPI0026DD2056|nr:porin [Fusobacterium sp.]MDO4690843.1 porin [Fusobacterium sp.]
MKKLALVLGSLLVVGAAASAKEVMPAPVVVPEKVVEIVEKPVIVYRDREVTPAWRPNGSVDVHLRNKGEIEGHKATEKDWDGSNWNTELRAKTSVNFTENQNLTVEYRDKFGLKRDGDLNKGDHHSRTELKHTYKFGNLGASKVNARVETKFRHGKNKFVEFKPVFDFSEYFFKNDYVKATALELAPFYRYTWSYNDRHANMYGLFANAEFELPYGVSFQAEFDDGIYVYSKTNRTEDKPVDADLTAKYGNVEFTLKKEFTLYKQGKHNLGLELEGVYATNWAWSRSDRGSIAAAGTERANGKKERWGGYEAKFDPHFNYSFQATDFVKLYTRVGAEFVNRSVGESESSTNRHGAKHWRWQPYVRVGARVTF